jgi:hypothetical protein
VLKFNEYEFILEKSIGSEETRLKWYADIDKHTFYKIVNLDPTSVRKKNFSKLGKYSKWLLIQYKKGFLNQKILDNAEQCGEINYYLFIFSTNWWKKCVRFDITSTTGSFLLKADTDILKYNSLNKFMSEVNEQVEKYEAATEKSKFDVIFSNENINILVPLNFTASFETARNTQWCSQSIGGYKGWSAQAILFRIMPKQKGYDKLKLTWSFSGTWYLACSRYPEIMGRDYPFEKNMGEENWKKIASFKVDSESKGVTTTLSKNVDEIKKTMELLTNEAKDCIMDYYIKYRKSS